MIRYHDFTNYSDFINTITKIGTLNEPALVDQLWDSLVENQQVPFIKNDFVAFLYRSSASEVNLAGDFNGWNPSWKGK